MNKKPVTLITGYLGSGKTTLLNEILRQEKRHVALIVNDMGSINIDAAIIKKNGSALAQSEMYEMQNGCICCTLRDEFIEQVEKISEKEDIECVFVEASGISDPGAIAASFLAFEKEKPETNVYLSNIVTVVDADRIYREFLTDLLDKSQLDQVEKIIRDFQPKAEIIKTSQGKVEIDSITSKEKFNYEMVDSSSAIQKAINSLSDEYGISSFSYEYKKPFDQAGRNSSVMAVAYWVAALDEKTQKECLEGDEELRSSWDPEYGDRINQIVFIGKNYNKSKIISRLEQCLA